MRPYLAVLKDSFREAMASRVLWIALIGIVMLLLGLAPFGLRNDVATQLRRQEVVDTKRLLQELQAARDTDGTPAARVWSLLNDDQRTSIDEMLDDKPEDETSERPRRGGFNDMQRTTVDMLNKLLEMPEFHDAESFADVELNEEAQQLVARENLSAREVSRRNLLLLVAAFPRAIRIVDENAMTLTYGGTEVFGPLPISASELGPVIDELLIGIVAVFLGFFGVFASLLVTAGMMPKTFEPGEIALLLSKPVSRSLLFLTKFFGGCCFTLLCAATLVGGIWALLGLRLGIWKHELLYSIPIYVFLFAIYFSISAVTGAIWKNAIVSLALVVVFWIGLTTIESTRVAVEEGVVNAERITEIAPVDAGVIVVNSSRETRLWNPDTGEWDEIFARPGPGIPAFAQRFAFSGLRFRPVYDPQENRIVAIDVPPRGGAATLLSGAADDRWERETEGQVPGQVRDVFVLNNGTVILPDRQAIYEFAGQTDKEKQTQKFLSGLTGGLLNSTSNSAFRPVQPKDMPDIATEYAVAMDSQTGTLIYYGEGVVQRLDRGEDGMYTLGPSRDLETTDSAVVAMSGGVVTVATSGGNIFVLNSTDLETLLEDHLPDDVLPKIAEASPDGASHAVLTHDNTLWLLDVAAMRPLDWRPVEDGVTNAVAYDAAGHLLVTDGRISVRSYNVASAELVAEYSAPQSWVYKVYDYGIKPLHTVLPKPSELDNFVRYTLTDQTSVPVSEGRRRGESGRRELLEERVKFDVWKPLLSNIAFLAVVLGIGCLYVSRSDF